MCFYVTKVTTYGNVVYTSRTAPKFKNIRMLLEPTMAEEHLPLHLRMSGVSLKCPSPSVTDRRRQMMDSSLNNSQRSILATGRTVDYNLIAAVPKRPAKPANKSMTASIQQQVEPLTRPSSITSRLDTRLLQSSFHSADEVQQKPGLQWSFRSDPSGKASSNSFSSHSSASRRRRHRSSLRTTSKPSSMVAGCVKPRSDRPSQFEHQTRRSMDPLTTRSQHTSSIKPSMIKKLKQAPRPILRHTFEGSVAAQHLAPPQCHFSDNIIPRRHSMTNAPVRHRSESLPEDPGVLFGKASPSHEDKSVAIFIEAQVKAHQAEVAPDVASDVGVVSPEPSTHTQSVDLRSMLAPVFLCDDDKLSPSHSPSALSAMLGALPGPTVTRNPKSFIGKSA